MPCTPRLVEDESGMNQVRALYALLFLTLGGLGAWVWKLHEKEATTAEALRKADTERAVALAARDQEHQQAVREQAVKHQEDFKKLNADFEKRMEELRRQERARLAKAYEQFSSILDGDKKTMDYINLIEQKVKAGREMSKAEAEQLAVIATGLAYLQRQYAKPFEEFGELEAYLQKRASALIESPSMRNAFWKRLFSREFREKEREFYRNEGERRGFQEAQAKFGEAYASAQKRMEDISLDLEKTVAKLNDVIEQKQAAAPDLGEFFSQARKALNAHQKLLEFEPELTKPAVEAAKP